MITKSDFRYRFEGRTSHICSFERSYVVVPTAVELRQPGNGVSRAVPEDNLEQFRGPRVRLGQAVAFANWNWRTVLADRNSVRG